MDEFWIYLKLGLTHVLDANAYDHVLYLIALVASYTFFQWKRVIWLVTIFTIGHTLSLVLAGYDLFQVNMEWVEFLIPLSIIIAAIYNLSIAGRRYQNQRKVVLYVITLFFGLVHGFGFSSYFQMLAAKKDQILLMLVEFALGIEIAQIIVVLTVLLISFIGRRVFTVSRRDFILVTSSLVIGLAIPILLEKWFF
ncbi:MAG: HupE/UreJ family protein [Psychroflexus sp.]|nr:HupE/UreJ family protein [Psychroflexus sp.]